MTRGTIRAWFLVHKWTSLACTLFLLMLCLTGLPLIFHDEIEAASGQGPAPVAGPPSSGDAPGLVSLDTVVARALATRPGEVPLFMAFDNASPLVTVTTGPRPDAPAAAMTLHLLDRTTGRPTGAPPANDSRVMGVLPPPHTHMFPRAPGVVLLGGVGFVFFAREPAPGVQDEFVCAGRDIRDRLPPPGTPTPRPCSRNCGKHCSATPRGACRDYRLSNPLVYPRRLHKDMRQSGEPPASGGHWGRLNPIPCAHRWHPPQMRTTPTKGWGTAVETAAQAHARHRPLFLTG